MTVPFKLTVDGYESQWQTNYLAPHIFTSSLMPLMLWTASLHQSHTRVRVINVSSDMGNRMGPKTIQFDDVNMTKAKGPLELYERYGHSKQASIRDAAEINDRFSAKGVTAYALHPGVVRTNLQDENPSVVGRVLRARVLWMFNNTTIADAALNSLWCATSRQAPREGAGKFLLPVGKAPDRVDKVLEDKDVNWRLYERSEEVAKMIA